MNVLNITDGTTTVNLLNLADGFSVDDWRQKIAQYKGGGTWSQSALTDGQRLVAKSFDITTEEIPMPGVKGECADIAAAGLATLLMLLEKASDYWKDDWHSEPVWVESQSDGETNTQYALIHAGGFPDLGDPYSHAFLENAVLTDLVLRLVRGHWEDNQPKVGTALPISVVEIWDLLNYGNVDNTRTRATTTAAEVYSVNKRCEANITHVYHVDVGAPDVWTDLVAAVPPYNLFPVGVAVGDFLVLGIECPATQNYPFSNLIFDIGTAALNIDTIWEYWDGAAPWGALDTVEVLDNTDVVPHPPVKAFTVLGVNGVWWTQPSDWVKGDLNTIFGAPAPAVDGFWVRCRVTGIPLAQTIPRQLIDIYTCTWPYIEVQAADIGGHIDAINTIITQCRSDDGDSVHGTTLERHARRVIGGLRSVDRGDEFASFLNLADGGVGDAAQNPPNISHSLIAPLGETTFQTSSEYPVYHYVRYAPVADRALAEEFLIYIDNEDFYGSYRVFARVKQVGGTAGDIGVRIEQKMGLSETVIKTSQTQYTTIVADEHILEFGEFTIPGIVPLEVDAPTSIVFSLSTSNAAIADLYLFELILIPTDEFCFDVWETGVLIQGMMELNQTLEIDSIIDPKRLMRAVLLSDSTGDMTTIYNTIAGDRVPLHPDARQRYWFLFPSIHTTGQTQVCYFYTGVRSQMETTQRYLGRRGSG